MANLFNIPAHWANESTTETHQNIWQQWIAFTNTQEKNQTIWFLVSLVFQGVLCLPIPAALMYYYHAPIIVIVITMALFFANIIAGMGSAGIRVLLTLFAVSIITNLLMLLVFIL